MPENPKALTRQDESVDIPNEVVGLVVLEGYTMIKAWRVYKGLSVTETAAVMALDIQDYERLETNPAPSKYELKCAADTFGIREHNCPQNACLVGGPASAINADFFNL